MNQVEIRNMKCKLGSLSRPDGSALFTLGETVTLSAVYGPVEVKPQKLLIEGATIEVFFKPIGLPSVADKLKEATLSSTFKTAILSSQHPRTSISIIVQEMQDSGGLLACSINSACLALINAGVPLRFPVAAISCMINNEDEIILDPNLVQLKSPLLLAPKAVALSYSDRKVLIDLNRFISQGTFDSKATFTLVFDGTDKNVIASETSGVFSKEQFEEILNTCKEASSIVFEFYRDVIKKSTVNSLNK